MRTGACHFSHTNFFHSEHGARPDRKQEENYYGESRWQDCGKLLEDPISVEDPDDDY
jgi:hypothetical protein